MAPVVATLGVRIPIPAEAVIPLAIATGGFLIVLFAGAALKQWQARHPAAARAFGVIVAAIATAGAVFVAAGVVPATQSNDTTHEGVQLVSLLDPIIAAVAAALAAMLWRFAGLRWLGFLAAGGVAAALIAKPWTAPLVRTWNRVDRTLSPTSETHLYFLLSGLALAALALIVAFTGLRARRAPLPTATALGR